MDKTNLMLHLRSILQLSSELEWAHVLAALGILAGDGVALQDVERVKSIPDCIAALDAMISEQLNLILHHPEFQSLEGTWRGLLHLVENSDQQAEVKIRVFNIPKDMLRKQLKRFKGTAWDQSPMFCRIYDDEYDSLGGNPYGCLVGDYYFSHSPEDVEVLSEMAKIAAAGKCPFIVGTAPELCRLESWRALSKPRDLVRIFTTPAYASWRSLRESTDSRYLGLAMPRFLARQPYVAKSASAVDSGISGFAFVENTKNGDHHCYTWANAVYALASNISRSFGLCGGFARVLDGGTIDLVDLADQAPVCLPGFAEPAYEQSVQVGLTGLTETIISRQREFELASCGLISLRPNLTLSSAWSLEDRAGERYVDGNTEFSSWLPHILTRTRFIHYIWNICKDKMCSTEDDDGSDLQRQLNDWINGYVDHAPNHSSAASKIELPLLVANILVKKASDKRYYSITCSLAPQMGELNKEHYVL